MPLRPFARSLLALSFGALAACDSGDAVVELRLMDAPPEGVTSVVLHVAAIEVHVDDKSKKDSSLAVDDSKKWRTLVVDTPIDLVQHQGESAAEVLGALELPEGKITQVRLVLDTAERQFAVFNGAECELDVSKVDAKGIKIPHVFKAFETKAGSETTVWVDFELDKSMKPSGDCFTLDPVLKLHKVKTDGKDVAI